MKRPLLFLLASPFIASLAVAACGSSDDCNETKTCTGASSGSGGLDGGDGSTDGPVIVPPKDCDLTKEPKDSPACVDDMVGVFVDAQSGVDSGPGTKTSPVKTIKAALEKAGQKRIYICEGTYKEHVKLTGPNSMYGGFGCMKWDYTGTKAKIAPEDKGYALHAEKLSSAIVISDLDFSVVDATEPGESSIGMFFSESSKVSLKRVDVKAGKGKDGADGLAPPTNLFSATPADYNGIDGTGGTGGAAKTCACKQYGSSTGAKGGNGGSPAGEAGGNGSATPQPPNMDTRNGSGGLNYMMNVRSCTNGVSGADGVPRKGGVKATDVGKLDAKGWSATDGVDGEAGNPGGGGGGGGGGPAGAGGGGGACGGCGGAGGLGGKGGGSSIALIVFATAIALDGVTFTASTAGKGGKGSKGEAGIGGGGGGDRGAVGGCAADFGGNGAGGGGGAGGSGGVSVGMLRKGGILEGTLTGVKGPKGEGGASGDPGNGGMNSLSTAGNGLPGDVGHDGASQDVLEIQ